MKKYTSYEIELPDDCSKGWDEAIKSAYNKISSMGIETENEDKRTSLSIYHSIDKSQRFRLGAKIICYTIIDNYLEKPTDSEYEFISEKCIDIYLKKEGIEDLIELCDFISKLYAKQKFVRDNKKMSK